MVDHEGVVHHRYYRKPQKKPITLHDKSHHPTTTKIQTIKQFYQTAETCSSTEEYAEESRQKVDKLLKNNGYPDPRPIRSSKVSTTSYTHSTPNTCIITLPYISDSFTDHINSYIRTSGLPVRLVLTPGKKLHQLFCSSRPHDRPVCNLTNCIVCPCMSGKYDCSVKGVVYNITCDLCGEFYVGETSRPVHDRFLEHRQAATTPHKHPSNGIACHYLEKHNGILPSLKLEILTSGTTNTITRKIYEAAYIKKLKPQLNAKEECEIVQAFLLH